MDSVEFFSDHCYSVLWDNQTKYFDNKDDDSGTETSNDLPEFTDGIKVRNRNQYNLVPGPILRILDHTAFPTEKSADIETCDEEFDSPESAHQQTQGESPTEVHTTEDVPVAAEYMKFLKIMIWRQKTNPLRLSETKLMKSHQLNLAKLLARAKLWMWLSSRNDLAAATASSNSFCPAETTLLRANSSDPYKCELCESNRRYFSDSKQHMILKHTDSKVCWVCRQSFATSFWSNIQTAWRGSRHL